MAENRVESLDDEFAVAVVIIAGSQNRKKHIRTLYYHFSHVQLCTPRSGLE